MAEKAVRRRRGSRVTEPMRIILESGQEVTVNNYEDQLLAALQDSEDGAVATLTSVLRGKNDTAIVSAAKKLLKMGGDQNIPGRLRGKLLEVQLEAVEALKTVAGTGKVQTARAEAAGFLMEMQKAGGSADWPPNTEDERWRERMKNAESLCELPPEPWSRA